MSSDLLEQFLTLWVVIDPIGTVPVFIAVTAAIEAKHRPRVAAQATAVSAGILLLFLVAGQFVIHGLGIGLESFQIAGGIVLFLFALTMIFGEGKPKSEAEDVDDGGPPGMELAVFPLAIPSIASPGAMLAVVLLTDNNRFSVPEQIETAGLMLVVLACSFGLMLLAGPILRLIGLGGAAIVSRVMGMLLASVAIDNVIEAGYELIARYPAVG